MTQVSVLSLSPIYINLLLCTENIGPVLCIHFKIHSFRFYILDLIMILFFWIEFVKFNLYHEMDEMVNAYTYQYGYFVVDFRRNGKWHIVWFGLTHSRHEIDVCNTILKKPN